jgi:hypothetical protein
MSEYKVSLDAVGRWGRNRIEKDGSFNKKEQQDEFALIDMCDKLNCPVYITGINYVKELSYYENITAAIRYIQELIGYAAGRVKMPSTTASGTTTSTSPASGTLSATISKSWA